MKRCKGCLKFKTNSAPYCNGCYQTMRKYRVKPESVHKLLIEQIGKCAICGNPPTTSRKLSIDHDHHTGKIRGLLCTRCNMGLGYLSNIDILTKASKYLEQPCPDLDYVELISRVQVIVPDNLLQEIMNNKNLRTLRSKARYLSKHLKISEEAAMSRLRRFVSSMCRDFGDTNLCIPSNSLISNEL